MQSEWREVNLSELTTKITKGTTPSKKDGGFSSLGINFIKAESVDYDGQIDISKFAYINEAVHDKFKRSQLSENDILFSMAGAFLGKTGLVQKEHLPANTNQALALIRPDCKQIDPKFLHFYLRQRSVQHFVNNSTSQSAQPNINLQEIGSLKIRLPGIGLQKRIAKILSSLDDKIQLNRQTNQTLEAMAQALFKSWFVDFDPVIDNALAAGHEIPPELQARAEARKSLQARAEQRKASLSGDRSEQESGDILPESIRQLFPNRFVLDAQMGWIPEGWSKCTVADVSEKVFSGGTPNTRTSEYWNGNLNWFSSGETRNRLILETEKFITDEGVQNSSTKQSVSGDILIASAGQGHTRGQTSLNRINTYINQSVVCIRPASQKYSAWLFLNLHSRYEEMRGLSDSHSIRGSLTTKLLAGMKIVKPCDVLLAHFDQIVNDFIKKQSEAIRQILSLSKLRDTLLPKLISGELRLPESTSAAPQQETAAA